MVTNCIFSFSGKGGVGKSTSIDDLAYTLASSGYEVLVVDTDWQGAANKTFRGKSTSKDSYSTFFDEFMKNPVTKYTDESGYFEQWGDNNFHVQLPVSLDFAYIPHEIITAEKRYDDGFKDFVKSISESGKYDFVLFDLPQFQPIQNLSNADHIIGVQENFETIIPLIVTGATAHELNEGLDVYERFIGNKDEELKSKLAPVIIINKYVEGEHDRVGDHIRRRSISSEKLGAEIPVFALPHLEISSATREEYSFLLDKSIDKRYIPQSVRDEMDSIDQIDLIMNSSFSSLLPPHTESGMRYDRKHGDWRDYRESVGRIASHITDTADTEPRKKMMFFSITLAEKNELAAKYTLQDRTRGNGF